MASFGQQLKALLWRNILLKKRHKFQLFQEAFFPIYFVAVLAVIRSKWKPELKPAMTFPVNDVNDSRYGTPFGNNQSIFVAPDTPETVNWTKEIVAQLPVLVDYQMFQTPEEAEVKFKKDSSKVAAGINFYIDGNPNFYAIRMDYNAVPGTTDYFNSKRGSCRRSKNGTATDENCQVNWYLKSGFIQLQIAIENVLMRNLGVTTPGLESRTIQVQMMDKGQYNSDTGFVQTLGSIYFVISFSFIANFLAVNIVSEKEKKIKDGMLMMGLRSSVFWLSWTIVYLIMIMFAAGVVIAIIAGSHFYTQSNMFLLYLSFMLYGTSFIAFAFMITPFFNNARVAGAVTGFSTILISCLYLAVSQTREVDSYDSNVPAGVQWLMCLLSPIAFSTVIDQSLFLDIHKNGMGFDDSLTYGKFPLYAPILMLAVDTLLYAVLTVYFDKVVPGEYGVRYSPFYFLQPSYLCPTRKTDETLRLMSVGSGSQTADVEPVATDISDKVAMRISSLTKCFQSEEKVHNAVDDFSLDIYEGHITCLLGHNGAGKTTLVNMLTGVIPPTNGTAKIMGLDITKSKEMEEIRKRCGICPQHNILYDDLSCREHLEMFANIKGVPGHLVNQTVDQALKDVDLESQADVFSKDLSGGQKRKLSVAIALIGDPKLIFLDEPTAGMDPYSRRHLWSLLMKKKKGRVVLLTTHFMDEADILSDRKAFIRKGKLRCCGSSLFLKNKFGIGYHLTMVVTNNCQIEKVTLLLQSVIPSIQHQRSHGRELAYTVPFSEVDKFASLFETLDQKTEELGVKNYGVSMTTLEEVFLKLEADEKADPVMEETGEINQGYSNNGDGVAIDVTVPSLTDSSLTKPTVDGLNLTKQRFMALFKIRFLLMIRNIKALIFQIILPVALVVVGLVLAKTNEVSSAVYPKPLHLSSFDYIQAQGSLSQTSSLPSLLVFDAVNTPDSESLISNWKTLMLVDNYTAGTKNTTDVAPHYIGLQMNGFEGKALTNFVTLYNDTALHSIPVAINMVTQSILNASKIDSYINASSFPWPETRKDIEFNNGTMLSALLVGLAFILVLPGFASEIVQDREGKIRGQLRISGVNFNLYWGSIYLSDFLVYLIPSVIVLVFVLAMQIPGLSSGGAVGALVLLFITNIPFNILMALVVSFIFNKTETCTAFLPQLLSLMAMMPYLAVSLIDMLLASSIAIPIHYVCCVLDPPYIIFGGFYFISRVYLMAATTGEEVTARDYFKVDNHIIITLIMPLFHFLWMYWLLRVLDVWKTGGRVMEAFPCFANSIDTSLVINTDRIDDENEDVVGEKLRIETLSHQNTTNIVAYTSQLRKVFVKRTKKSGCCQKGEAHMNIAVRNLSIGVDKGEVLGLLGPNGAGKSTVLNMMIAETLPTSGKVVVSGHNIRSNMLSVLESLGYCPQHNALWETITLEEHIRCFAAIKGISPNHLDDVVQFYVSNLKLGDHSKKHSKRLSGGTKRKLSYILSILGSPHLVLLDEPSTGMDPQSKRFLWNTISSSFSNTDKGAILTTHYMEEADALCGRVGIMVNGQLKCLGSTQHLKSKYGSGYILEVKLASQKTSEVDSSMDKLEHHLKRLFPRLKAVERFMERAQFSVPRDDVTSLGKTFASLESCKTTHSLEEYNFSQSTLEQVFLHFAKQQVEEGVNVDSETKSVLDQQNTATNAAAV